jgi:hypothetical protein
MAKDSISGHTDAHRHHGAHRHQELSLTETRSGGEGKKVHKRHKPHGRPNHHGHPSHHGRHGVSDDNIVVVRGTGTASKPLDVVVRGTGTASKPLDPPLPSQNGATGVDPAAVDPGIAKMNELTAALMETNIKISEKTEPAKAVKNRTTQA